MSPRATRSSARQSAELSSITTAQSSSAQPKSPTQGANNTSTSRKRKAPAASQAPDQQPPTPDTTVRPRKRLKRTKQTGSDLLSRSSVHRSPPSPSLPYPAVAMSSTMPLSGNPDDESREGSATPASPGGEQARRGSSRYDLNPVIRQLDLVARSSKTGSSYIADNSQKGSGDSTSKENEGQSKSGTDIDNEHEDETEDMLAKSRDGDLFDGTFLSRSRSLGSSTTLRALSGMISGLSNRLADILTRLKNKDDPSEQFLALQELSEILLVSTEDNLLGQFSTDLYVKELILLMKPSELGDENPEMMLLACRCLANLMEALPSSTANVVYNGAVPVLCEKLFEIQFIDLAEQALSTLEKISVEFPSTIVREGGLTACLTYLDFFATSTQRTAVTIAANCCRNISDSYFDVVEKVMPTLLSVLNNSDQRVLEQGCLCVSRVVESFRNHANKLEKLVSTDLLRSVLRLLLPGTTNLIGPSIHTQFLRVLSITARASATLSADLLRMNVVDTLYQILAGVSPPSNLDGIDMRANSALVMQTLIHRPRDQIFESLNVICEILPPVTGQESNDPAVAQPDSSLSDAATTITSASRKTQALEDCGQELKRFAVILFPTLMDAYSSTINLSLRQKVLLAHLKMLSNLNNDILAATLCHLPYASFLTSILSQREESCLVLSALQATELLFSRMSHVYSTQFYREGVIYEVEKLAAPHPTESEADGDDSTGFQRNDVVPDKQSSPQLSLEECIDVESKAGNNLGSLADSDDEDVDNDDEDAENRSETHSSDQSQAQNSGSVRNPTLDHSIAIQASKIMQNHAISPSGPTRQQASSVLRELEGIAYDIGHSDKGSIAAEQLLEIFNRLASYFCDDELKNITSYELLASGILAELLKFLLVKSSADVRPIEFAFLKAFLRQPATHETARGSDAPEALPFNLLITKLQDLLSRSEHFEVFTVHHSAYNGSRLDPSSMLNKQLRLKLVADDQSGIPRHYRNITVSIHAIALFRALDDYLRPRISMAGRSHYLRNRDGHAEAGTAASVAASKSDTSAVQSIDGVKSGSPSDSTNRVLTRQASSSAKLQTATPTSRASEGKPEEKTRSSRRSKLQGATPPALLPLPVQEPVEEALECADETQLSEHEDVSSQSVMDTIMNDVDDNMDDEVVDPSDVKLEVAPTGNLIARKDDGTTVFSPLASLGPIRTPLGTKAGAEAKLPLTPVSTQRSMNYAAAVQSVPQDWHIQFFINKQPIARNTTVYRAVHFNQRSPGEVSYKNIWSAVHMIEFKRVSGPPPNTIEKSTTSPEETADEGERPLKLASGDTITEQIVRLLGILYRLSEGAAEILAEKDPFTSIIPRPSSQFINTKLTAKLNRQLEEPLIVASNCLPNWCEDLAQLYPFLFPFESRHVFLQSTSFGYSRSMLRWQSNHSQTDSRYDLHRTERPFVGRLQRQKVRISRAKLLESAVKVMELYGSAASVLEVEYFDEVGTGLGPTLEFYSLVSKEFTRNKLSMWRQTDSKEGDEYAFNKTGLFPAPMDADQAASESGKRILTYFKALGKFVARSMLDSRIIDIFFHPLFFQVGHNSLATNPTRSAISSIDRALGRALDMLWQHVDEKTATELRIDLFDKQKANTTQSTRIGGVNLDDLGLDFTLPGYPTIEMVPDGSNTPVTIENVDLYLEKVVDFTIGSGTRRQLDAFRAGFSEVFPYTTLRAFTAKELVMLFGRADEDWSLETLMDSIRADHGYNMDSRTVRNLLHLMSHFTAAERREFLQFVTGSPKLPIGGFKALTPMFTVVCKPSEPPFTSDDYLPSVMTCVNYLKMPNYSDMTTLRDKMNVAVKEGQGAFHLS